MNIVDKKSSQKGENLVDTIVFLGSNKSGTSRDALITAKEMGYKVVLLTDRKKFLSQKNEFPEVDKIIYLDKMEEAKVAIESLSQQGFLVRTCLSFIDPFVSLASRIQKELGLFHLSSDAYFLLEDKSRFREALSGLPSSPFYSICDGSKILEYPKHPLIIKPPISNGSKDVILVKSEHEFRKSMKTVKLPVLIEEYLDGPQYLIEVIIHNGKKHVLGILEQEIMNGDRFIVTGYQFPAVLKPEEEKKLFDEIEVIMNKINLSNGNCHLEMRLVKGEWKLIEINPRMSGGAMNRIIFEGTGVNMAKEIIKLNLGLEPNVERSYNQAVYAKFLTIRSRGRLVKVTGKNRALKHDGVKEVYVKPRKGTVLIKPKSLGQRYAYVLATGKTPEEAKKIAMNSAKEIRFVMESI